MKEIEQISDYINKNFSEKGDANLAFWSLKNLEAFFSLNHIDYNADLFRVLLRNNEILVSILESLGGMDFDSDFIRAWLDIYEEYKSNFSIQEVPNDLAILYLKDVQRVSLLTETETMDLALKKAKGSLAARQKLIEANLPLVISIAKKYRHLNIPFIDLVEEGNYGLIKAVDKFDINKGYKFSTFATSYIDGYIKKSIRNSNLIRIPNNKISEYQAFQKAFDMLFKDLSRKPTLKEVADYLGISLKKAYELANLENVFPISSDIPVMDEDDLTIGDLFTAKEEGYEEVIARSVDFNKIVEVLKLTAKQRYFFQQFFIAGKKRGEIAKELGCTKQNISLIESQVMRHIAEEKEELLVILGKLTASTKPTDILEMSRGPVSIYKKIGEEKEIVDYVIATALSDYSKYIIYLGWGSNLDKPVRKKDFTRTLKSYFNKVIVPEIKEKCQEVKEKLAETADTKWLFDIDLEMALAAMASYTPVKTSSKSQTFEEIEGDDTKEKVISKAKKEENRDISFLDMVLEELASPSYIGLLTNITAYRIITFLLTLGITSKEDLEHFVTFIDISFDDAKKRGDLMEDASLLQDFLHTLIAKYDGMLDAKSKKLVEKTINL